jgi:O-acetyl-ADP-ribose deacetylase (regulator of RNase III)
MIEWKSGDILQANTEAVVNTVNTVGVMGKGIALSFKRAFPEMFSEYQKLARQGRIQVGQMHVFDRGVLNNPRYIINFPTKKDWRAPSMIEYVTLGLKSLVREIQERDINSVAIPPLGCGSGGLNWSEVKLLIEQALEEIPQVHAAIYAPQTEFSDHPFKMSPSRPEMTISRAKVLSVLRRYTELGYEITLIEVHKLLYFLQEAGEPLRLRFTKGTYGPYADNLRFVLQAFEGHFTKGFVESRNTPRAVIELLPEAMHEADTLLKTQADDVNSSTRLNRVEKLIEGYESPYGLELLASVHWTVKHEHTDGSKSDAVINGIQAWNERKRKVMQPMHIEKALHRLINMQWI